MSQFKENEKKRFSKNLKSLVKGWEEANGKKLSQEKIAEAAFVARETVSGWFNGKSYPAEDAINRLADFFNVPAWYFTKDGDEGLTLYYEGEHEQLEKDCEEIAQSIGLSSSFVSFIKENPALSDAVISASWVDILTQSLSPSVPLIPENTFQFVSSSNVKIYPPKEVLLMLRVVQRDLTEYASFLIEKWTKIIDSAHHDEKGEIYLGNYGFRYSDSHREYCSASDRFSAELKNRGSITPGAALIVDLYDRLSGLEQMELIDAAKKLHRESRKKSGKKKDIPEK